MPSSESNKKTQYKRTYAERRREAINALRQMKAAGIVDEGYTLVDLLDQMHVHDTIDDRIIEAESVLIYYGVRGEGFRQQVCPECGETFAYKYRTIAQDILNQRMVRDTMKPELVQKIEDDNENIRAVQSSVEKHYGFRCSNACRALSLMKIGIIWSPWRKPEDRWVFSENDKTQGELPMVVPPGAFEILKKEHGIEPEFTE